METVFVVIWTMLISGSFSKSAYLSHKTGAVTVNVNVQSAKTKDHIQTLTNKVDALMYAVAKQGKTIIKLLAGKDTCDNANSNVAFGKPAYQSSIKNKETGYASAAVDGNQNAAYTGSRAGCTHTKLDRRAWWIVDLLEDFNISSVAITNRGDCCGERLSNFDVQVSREWTQASNTGPFQSCAYVRKLNQGETRAIRCKTPLIGQYVRIMLRGSNYLTLCEVGVYGKRLC